jgi:intraflagellar transport protein 172
MRVSVGLLRYSDLIRLDKLYFDAGIACQKAEQLPMAIKFLNRYLDINDLIEDPDNNNLDDGSDYANTDIPSPLDVPFPEKNLISPAEKDKIKDWLLQIAMNKKVSDALPTRPCDKCSTPIFEAALTCFKCKTKYEPCILTGYPALYSNSVKCRTCAKPAIKDNWSIYLTMFANCPWCNGIPN